MFETRNFLSKTNFKSHFLSKALDNGGKFCSKLSTAAGGVLDAIGTADPMLRANPLFMGAKTLATAGKIVGDAVQEASHASDANGVVKSLQSAYQGVKGTISTPVPGAEVSTSNMVI